MTFLVAFARPDFALLASDTRSTYRPAPDAPAVGFTDDGVKIQPFGTGWLASGPSEVWRQVVLDADAARDPGAYTGAMRKLDASAPALAAVIRERQLTMTIGMDAGGCFRHVADWQGVERFPGPPHHVVALCPNGSDPATMQRRLNAYQAAIRRAALPEILRATAQLYAAVYGHCGPQGTVSPLLSVGLAHMDGRRELLGPLSHDAFLHEVAHV
jgi:hypothetical protein